MIRNALSSNNHRYRIGNWILNLYIVGFYAVVTADPGMSSFYLIHRLRKMKRSEITLSLAEIEMRVGLILPHIELCLSESLIHRI